MRINVWGINYAPELTGIAVYNTELCEFLAAGGDKVTMVTGFPYYPSWRKRPEDRWCIYRTERDKQVEVCRCWLYVRESPSVVLRILHEATFAVASSLKQLFLPAPDAYVVVSPPLILGLAAWIVSRIKGTPFHFHVQDLQPDAAFGMNMLRGGWLARILYGLEKLAYEKAGSISGISAQMCETFSTKGVPSSKIVFFPNWVNLPNPSELPAKGAWKCSRGIAPGTPIVSYAGNLGVKQGLELIIGAARLLKGKHPVLFVIAGYGSKRALLELWKREFELDNVLIEGVLSESEHSSLLIDSEICLITQKPGSGASFLPSKLLKTLALERPVLTNAEPTSALSQALAEGRSGRVVADSNAEQFAKAIVEILADEPARTAMGECGRAYVARFNQHSVLEEFCKHLHSLRKPPA